jgi:hypothetical protein
MRFLTVLALLAGSLSGCSSVHVATQNERPFYTLNHQAHARHSVSIQFSRSLP